MNFIGLFMKNKYTTSLLRNKPISIWRLYLLFRNICIQYLVPTLTQYLAPGNVSVTYLTPARLLADQPPSPLGPKYSKLYARKDLGAFGIGT